MKFAYIATYPPRQCGIGTFTRNKFFAMTSDESVQGSNEGIVIAINDNNNQYDYPPEVEFVIRQGELEDYIEAAQFINGSGADICILEHEYGIFGGDDGVYILSLLQRLRIPFIAVLHTIVRDASYQQKKILQQISDLAAKTVVMAQKAVELLIENYQISEENIAVVEHGVPDTQLDQDICIDELELRNKTVMLTFGLISRNKGIETVIKALPPVIEKYPGLLYIVLGKTHPAVVRQSGEEYRDHLVEMAHQLQVDKHIVFLDEFVDENKLMKYLSAASIYVTPYQNEAQITSGTLAYAIGAGCAVVSTAYWHAAELSSKELVRLFDFKDVQGLSHILMDLLDHPEKMKSMQEKARLYGRQTVWTAIGRKYIRLAKKITQDSALAFEKRGLVNTVIPVFSLDHIKRLTDQVGIIQHAKYIVPNFKEGYCLDDNARALLMTAMAYKQKRSPDIPELMRIYLGYIHYMQKENGDFYNFLGFDRQIKETFCSEDAFGRTIWALGYLLGNPTRDSSYELGKEIFHRSMPHFKAINSPRSIANVMIGICYYLQQFPGDKQMIAQVRSFADVLVNLYKHHSSANWKWFELYLTYDNGLLPLSLLHASSVLQDDNLKEIAIETTDFLATITLSKGYLSPVGNKEWYVKDGNCSTYAQQPVDAMAMVLLFREAFQLTKNEKYLQQMNTSFMWFLGQNELLTSLYDHESRGCYDGLEKYGLNRNQGAESTLAYLIARLAFAPSAERKQFIEKHVNGMNGAGVMKK